MTYDCITFNGEHNLFEIRYNILKDYVDEFVVFEFDKTFSGKPKESTFKHFLPKVTYHFVTEDVYSRYMELALHSPNTIGADHWKREFCQKESIKDYLTNLKDEDFVYIGDCDEIWEGNYEKTEKFLLRVYTYYLNNRSNEVFWGTLVARWGDIKDKCLNHLRSDSTIRGTEAKGWHFTSLKDGLRKKLEDSYTKESYATDEVMDNLEQNVFNNKDFLGRPFTFHVDESELPQYLLDNKEKWIKLFRS